MVDLGNSGKNLLKADYFKKQRDKKQITKVIKSSAKMFGGMGYTEAKPFYTIVVDELEIGNHKVNKLVTTVKCGGGNNLGLDFFKNYRIILNWKEKRMKMIEVKKADNDSYQTFGFSNLFEENAISINNIFEGSSASELLEHSEVVLSINNIRYTETTKEQYSDFWQNQSYKENDNLNISIQKDGKVMNFELKKRTLL